MRNLLRVIHISFLFLSCSEQSVTFGPVFRFNMETALNSLDPAFARDQFGIWASSQFFNGLVQLDSAMNVVPAVAYRWERHDSGKIWRFFLRGDVRFQKDPCFSDKNGRVVTAADFVYSFNRLVDPVTASPGAWIFNDKITEQRPFRALSDSVFEIHLKTAFPPLAGMLAMPYCFVIPHEAVEHYGKDFRAHPVGTGPFRLHHWEEGIKLIAEKNPDYFEFEQGKRLPYLDGFEVSFIESKQTAFLEFIQGRLDFFSGLEGSYKDELLTRDGKLREKYQGKFQLSTGPYLNTEYLGFLMDSTVPLPDGENPFLDKNLRKALSFAVNREEMMRYLRNNIGTPGNRGFIPEGLPGFAGRDYYSYNKDSARYYLSKSTYKQQVLHLYTTKNYLDLTVYVQRMWQEIGVRSEIEVNPGPFHRERVSKSQFGCFRGSWLADYPDAENYLALFYSPNFAPAGPNYTHYRNPFADSLYRAALAAETDSACLALYRQMDAAVMEDAPVLVLFYDKTLHLLSNRVSRMPVNALNHLSIKYIQFHETPR